VDAQVSRLWARGNRSLGARNIRQGVFAPQGFPFADVLDLMPLFETSIIAGIEFFRDDKSRELV
jgi:hypothetical protein